MHMVCVMVVECTGNLCFGKCCGIHCSLWAVQTINFQYNYMQHRMFKLHLKLGLVYRSEVFRDFS